MDVLGSLDAVHLVPWLRRRNIHLPPAYAHEPRALNLATIQQYAQNLGEQEWVGVESHLRAVCAQHGWAVTDSLPVDIVDIPPSPKPEDIIEVPVEEAPKRRKKVVRVKRVHNKKK